MTSKQQTADQLSGIEQSVLDATGDPILRKMLDEERVEAKSLDTALLLRLLGYVRPHVPLALFTVLLAIIEAFMMTTPAWVVGLAIDKIAQSEREPGFFADLLDSAAVVFLGAAAGDESYRVSLVTFYGLVIAAVWLCRWCLGTSTSYLVRKLGQYVVHDLRMDVHRHIVNMDSPFFEKNPVGRLVNRATFDVASLSELFSDAFAQGMRDILFVIVLLVVMLVLDVPLALILLGALPLLTITMMVYRHFGRPALRTTSAVISRMNAWLAENLAGMRENQIYRTEDRRRAEFGALTVAHQKAVTRVIAAWGLLRPAMMVTTGIATAAVLLIGHDRVTEGLVSVGVLLTFLQYTVRIWVPIRNLSEKFNLIQTALTAGERVFDILDTKPKLVTLDTAKPDLVPTRGRIEFDDVRFRYPRSDADVLNGIDFDVAAGQMLALVGDTGAGKSTIVKLLSRFHDVTSGVVRVDGHDVRDYVLQQLRKGMALVPQDVVIFAGTLRENITLGRDVTDERIWECLEAVCADEMVHRFEAGLDHELEEGGRTLSTGERQLLSFARALVVNPPILILDEATANVDTQTEQKIQQALENLTRGRTSVVIAHRLSTIVHADQILVLRHGRVVERGSHEELLALGREYARLHELHHRGQ